MTNREEVIQWIRDGMNYEAGIPMAVKYTGNTFYTKFFSGKERSQSGKLAYILCCAAGEDVSTWKDFIASVNGSYVDKKTFGQKVSGQKLSKHEDNQKPVIELEETIEEATFIEYPSVIRRIIHEYAATFQERSKLHDVLAQMPDSNVETVCKKRAEILNVIKSQSERLETLHNAKLQWEKSGVTPKESELFNIPDKDPEPDYNSMDIETLKKKKKNLQSSNSKDQTLLDYQEKGQGADKNPMPHGPKRSRIEIRMKERNKEIEKIEYAILKQEKGTKSN